MSYDFYTSIANETLLSSRENSACLSVFQFTTMDGLANMPNFYNSFYLLRQADTVSESQLTWSALPIMKSNSNGMAANISMMNHVLI